MPTVAFFELRLTRLSKVWCKERCFFLFFLLSFFFFSGAGSNLFLGSALHDYGSSRRLLTNALPHAVYQEAGDPNCLVRALLSKKKGPAATKRVAGSSTRQTSFPAAALLPWVSRVQEHIHHKAKSVEVDLCSSGAQQCSVAVVCDSGAAGTREGNEKLS